MIFLIRQRYSVENCSIQDWSYWFAARETLFCRDNTLRDELEDLQIDQFSSFGEGFACRIEHPDHLQPRTPVIEWFCVLLDTFDKIT